MGSELQDACRLCTGTFLSLVPMFGNDDLPMKIENITSLEVKLNDGLPAQVCHQCVQLVNLCYHFKLRCENSDNYFRQGIGFLAHDYDHECVPDKDIECSGHVQEETYSSQQQPHVPEYLLEDYVPQRPGKKPHFPVDALAQLLQQYKDVVLNKEGQIQAKTAPCWQFLCDQLNTMLAGTYSTTPNNIYTYVKCNRYNLQSHLGINTERRRSPEAYDLDDIPDGNIEMRKVKFAINLSEEEWLRMYEKPVVGQPFLNRRGLGRINRYFKMATEVRCRMSLNSIAEVGKTGVCLKIYGKCCYCESEFTGQVASKEVPGQAVVVNCTYQFRGDQKSLYSSSVISKECSGEPHIPVQG